MSFRVSGTRSTINRKLTDKTAPADADNLVRDSIHRLGGRASGRAPVDTGLLSSTMISGIHKSYSDGSELHPVWDLLQRTEYTLVQEFEHKSQDRFIRDSAIEERPKFKQELERRYKKGGGSK